MKKSRFLAGALVTFGLFSLLAGCQQAPAQPQKPAEEVIKEGMKKLTELTSYSYELVLKGDMKDPAAGATKFDVTLAGQVDVKDPKDPKVTLKLSGSAGDDQAGGEGTFDLRLNKEAVYFNVMKFSMKGGEALPPEITDLFSKWWKITLPPEAADELAKSVPQGAEETLTPEQLKMKKLMEETKFFAQPKFVGMENVKGENSYHYSVTLDKKALIEFMKKAAESEGQSIGPAEMADAEKAFEKMDISGDVFVGATSGVLNKFSGTINIKGSESESSGTINVSITVGDLNKPVTIDVPAGAEEFPIEQFLGPLLGGGMMAPADLGTEGLSEEEKAMMEKALEGGEFEFDIE